MMKMREILFRGKWGKQWLYGDLTHSSTKETMYIDNYISFPFQVAPETVGQFTGLTDKNGNKIFEGNIVTFDKEYGGETKEKGTVYWCDGAFWVENVQDEEGYGLFGALAKYQIEIIGNIHDNPELLKEK